MIFFTARVLRTGDDRYWIGAGIGGLGLGVLSKYSIAFLVISLYCNRYPAFLRSAVICATGGSGMERSLRSSSRRRTLIWLVRHHFITLQMEHFIHARDVRHGRADGYYTDQIKFTLLGLPLAIAGLVSLLRSPRFRLLGVLYIGPFILFAIAKGRGYYLMPAYTVLYAAGAVALLERLRAACRVASHRRAFGGYCRDAVRYGALLMGIPADVACWFGGMELADGEQRRHMRDEVGWPEFVAQVAAVRDTLSPEDRSRLAVLANNYGEAGALALYGPQYGLPTPISSTNTFHDRGYGPYEAETVIVTGGELEDHKLTLNVAWFRRRSTFHMA